MGEGELPVLTTPVCRVQTVQFCQFKQLLHPHGVKTTVKTVRKCTADPLTFLSAAIQNFSNRNTKFLELTPPFGGVSVLASQFSKTVAHLERSGSVLGFSLTV
jgi:hypothetical protein